MFQECSFIKYKRSPNTCRKFFEYSENVLWTYKWEKFRTKQCSTNVPEMECSLSTHIFKNPIEFFVANPLKDFRSNSNWCWFVFPPNFENLPRCYLHEFQTKNDIEKNTKGRSSGVLNPKKFKFSYYWKKICHWALFSFTKKFSLGVMETKTLNHVDRVSCAQKAR